MGVPSSLPPVPQTYTEWAATERAAWPAAELGKRAEYWKTKLAGARQIWPAADAAERAAEPLQRWVSSIPPELTTAVRELARRSGATLFSTLLSAFQITLSKRTGQDDILVGTPVANRNKASARQTMGYFAGVVPLRAQVDRALTFSSHLKAAHDTAIDGFANAMPFAEIASALGEPRAPGLHSIFDVRFALQNHPTPDVVLPRIATKLRMRSTGTARFDLGCEITEIGSEMEVVWLFKSRILPAASIAEINAQFLAVLTRSCRDPQSRISDLTE
jgi:non-ribosomal peptide synthetase component F